MKNRSLNLAIGLALGLMAATSLHAQQAGDTGTEAASTKANSTSAKQLGTVTVTARKREETLQDVPIAVSAFTGARCSSRTCRTWATCRARCPRCRSTRRAAPTPP